MTQRLPYTSFRGKIRDGDALLFRGRSFYSSAIQLWCRSPWSHAGKAIWIRKRLFVAEAMEGKGVRLYPLSDYLREGARVYWFPFVAGMECDREMVVDYVLRKMGREYASVWQFITSFAYLTRLVRRYLGKPPNVDRKSNRWFCSMLCAAADRYAGASLPKDIALITPADYADLPYLHNRGELINDY